MVSVENTIAPKQAHDSEVRLLDDWIMKMLNLELNLLLGCEVKLEEVGHWGPDLEVYVLLLGSSVLCQLAEQHEMSSFRLPDSSPMPFLPR